ncbi:diacylglycerol kinase [Arsenophonus sp. ENCA]|uniref:diacylglycerol kinase n=1 Tax=unclassified Arsenophonus TaxID=2627083 RepID=UPI000BCBA483|nr:MULTISPECIES: diacylglycerol kinase [unclassified Arsenophonus]MDR5609955.1 diacylglycerol kinase [Arsenophonus sp.]MDR5613627.1 diacylglycerol kinase [Arsenophonus sp.]PAV01382.1 diacylglycerol kinase [Arsenophonus sp. ENCA]
MANQTTGLTRIIKATGYSLKGLRAAWKSEAAFRQEAIMVVIAIIVAFLLDVQWIERLLLISSMVLIAIVELLNSAIEAVVDRIGTELHELSAKAKDIGSAAVFISICLAIFIWSVVIGNHYFVS